VFGIRILKPANCQELQETKTGDKVIFVTMQIIFAP